MKQRTILQPPMVDFIDPQTVHPQATPVERAPVLREDDPTRDVQRIAVTLIDANPFAPREVYTSAMLTNMAESLRTKKQREVIHVIPHPEIPGRFMIGDGWTRVQACLHYGGGDSLLAEVHHTLTPLEASWFGYDQNEERNGHTDLDRARFYQKLHEGGMSQVEIAARAKRSKSAITKFMSFNKLPSELMQIVEANASRFGANHAYLLQLCVEKAGQRRAISLAQRCIDENLPFKWLQNQVLLLTDPPHRNKPSTQRVQRFKNGTFKRNDGKFSFDFTVPEDMSEEVEAYLMQIVQKIGVIDDEQSGVST